MPRTISAILAWLAILAGAVLNGALREAVLIPALGSPWALAISGILLSALILLVAWLFVAKSSGLSSARYLVVGALWLGLTLVFEFSFGRVVQGKPWSELLAAYQFHNGNLWPIVLLVVLLAPWAVARFSGHR